MNGAENLIKPDIELRDAGLALGFEWRRGVPEYVGLEKVAGLMDEAGKAFLLDAVRVGELVAESVGPGIVGFYEHCAPSLRDRALLPDGDYADWQTFVRLADLAVWLDGAGVAVPWVLVGLLDRMPKPDRSARAREVGRGEYGGVVLTVSGATNVDVYWPLKERMQNGGLEIDWNGWLKRACWTPLQAAALIHSVIPEFWQGTFKRATKTYVTVLEDGERFAEVAALIQDFEYLHPAPQPPVGWVRLAVERGLDLPPALRGLVEGEIQIPENVPQKPQKSTAPRPVRLSKAALTLKLKPVMRSPNKLRGFFAHAKDNGLADCKHDDGYDLVEVVRWLFLKSELLSDLEEARVIAIIEGVTE